MEITIIKNDNDKEINIYKLARIIFAETKCVSLKSVESLAVMIYNIHLKQKIEFSEIANDKSLFESLNKNSLRHQYLFIDEKDSKFQMCLRIVRKMINGKLVDNIMGATKFHRSDILPDWATSLGYVAETENLFFYI